MEFYSIESRHIVAAHTRKFSVPSSYEKELVVVLSDEVYRLIPTVIGWPRKAGFSIVTVESFHFKLPGMPCILEFKAKFGVPNVVCISALVCIRLVNPNPLIFPSNDEHKTP